MEEIPSDEEQPQASNFKKKAEVFLSTNLDGSKNGGYRSIVKLPI